MKVLWLRHAEEALYRTEAYILKEYGESASGRFIKEVREIAYLLEKMPELGHYEPLLSHHEQGYRSIVRNISQRCDCCLKKGRIDFTEKLAFLGLTKDTVKLTNEGIILSRQQALYTMSD